MAYFLAVDAGGTKTDYALADESRILARVRTGTIKRMRTDAATAVVHLESALSRLYAQSGVAMHEICSTCIGTAGETVPLVTDWLRSEFSSRVGGKLLLVGDVEIALDAAFPGGSGVLVLAGTGSNVAGRSPRGVLLNTGGYGPALSDQGSGHRIGLEALRASFLARDEGRPTRLLDAILDHWKLSSLDLLIEFANATPAPDFSGLTHVVLRCAEQKDEVAAAVLERQGEDLGYLVRLIIRRLQTLSADPSFQPRLAFAGSIMQRVLPVRTALLSAVQREFPGVAAMEGVVDPIEGAIWRARTLAGLPGLKSASTESAK